MKTVRLGVIGCGGMAQAHMRYFDSIPGLKFTAAADGLYSFDLCNSNYDTRLWIMPLACPSAGSPVTSIIVPLVSVKSRIASIPASRP